MGLRNQLSFPFQLHFGKVFWRLCLLVRERKHILLESEIYFHGVEWCSREKGGWRKDGGGWHPDKYSQLPGTEKESLIWWQSSQSISTKWFISGGRRAETVSLQSECGCRGNHSLGALCVLGLSLAVVIPDSAPSLACVNYITSCWPSPTSGQSAAFSFLGFLIFIDVSQVLFVLSFLFELVFHTKMFYKATERVNLT